MALTILALATALLFSPSAVAVGYPNPLPDFAHPGSPHNARLSVASGHNDRPLLVISGSFTDATGPQASDGQLVERFFGLTPPGPQGGGSVVGFFRQSSGGSLIFTQPNETSGALDDGVVSVNLGPHAPFAALSDGARGRRIVEAANPWVDFGRFDRNGDERIDDTELIIVLVQQADPTPADTNDCGSTRRIDNGSDLDNMDLGSGKQWSGGTTLTNTMTLIHEVSHQALGHNDHGYAAGQLDVSGPTCPSGTPNNKFFDYNSWHKIHFGWVKPRIVTHDGYVTIPRWDTSGHVYLLYNPDRGTNDYFLVENRLKEQNAFPYDRDASDKGLVIWRVTDSGFGTSFQYPYELMRPATQTATPNNYNGSSADAWDPSDPQTPQRTMTRNWADTTPSRVGVLAIGPAGPFITAYLDVPGPGILVDAPFTFQTTSAPSRARAAAATPAAQAVTVGETSPVTLDALNTGDETDTFRFELTDLPAGWSTTPTVRTLPPCAGGSNCLHAAPAVQLKVPLGTPEGEYTLRALATSTTAGSVSSSAPVTVRVAKRQTQLAYTGVTIADYSDPAAVSARLTDAANGAPVAGKAVGFKLGSQSASATTGADGVASTTIMLDQPAAQTVARASFAGDDTSLGSADEAAFTIEKETLAFAYTGDTLVKQATAPVLAARATEEADGHPGDLSRAAALFTLTRTLGTASASFSAPVSSTGFALANATGLAPDVWNVKVSVPDTNRFWQGGGTGELVVFDPASKATGGAAGTDTRGAPVQVTFNAKYNTGRATGSAVVRTVAGTFSANSLQWVVQVGNQAIAQYSGYSGVQPATLRLTVVDRGEPGRPDTFRATTGAYDSGVVIATSGNIQTH